MRGSRALHLSIACSFLNDREATSIVRAIIIFCESDVNSLEFQLSFKNPSSMTV